MASLQPDEGDEPPLTVAIEPGMRKRIETAAAERGVSIGDYVVSALHQVLAEGDPLRPVYEAGAWGPLSSQSFERDWISDADAVYDDLA